MNKKHIALTLSVSGALLVISTQSHIRSIAFIAWSIANCIWCYEAMLRKDTEQIYLWSFYLITSLIGLVNNI
jgi:hypothetical protein